MERAAPDCGEQRHGGSGHRRVVADAHANSVHARRGAHEAEASDSGSGGRGARRRHKPRDTCTKLGERERRRMGRRGWRGSRARWCTRHRDAGGGDTGAMRERRARASELASSERRRAVGRGGRDGSECGAHAAGGRGRTRGDRGSGQRPCGSGTRLGDSGRDGGVEGEQSGRHAGAVDGIGGASGMRTAGREGWD